MLDLLRPHFSIPVILWVGLWGFFSSVNIINLCLSEKLCILTARDVSLLNKKSELVTECRHENKFFTINQKKCHSNYPEIRNLKFKTEIYMHRIFSLMIA